MKKRCLAFLTAMVCLCQPLWGLAEAARPVDPVERESGGVSFCLPQFADQPEMNEYYQAMGRRLDEAAKSALWEDGEPFPDGLRVEYEICRNDGEYVSVLLRLRQPSGGGETETLSAANFALQGEAPGEPVTLSRVLGAEETAENGETAATRLVYELVWEIVSPRMEIGEETYLDGLTPESLREAFDPETDFYMAEDGNLVFFVQPGVLAGEISGVLTFPFMPEELAAG